MTAPTAATLDRLFATIASRRGADAASSYTAKLLAAGVPLVARKLGEEAVETVVAAMQRESGQRESGPIVAESADLLYHLLVLWAACGIDPETIWAELERREGVSGIAEKASRPKT